MKHIKVIILGLLLGSIILISLPAGASLRQSSAPYISGDSFRALADHIYDETDRSLTAEKVHNRDIIFVKTDYLQDFFSVIHPQITNTYILITHNSDYSAPGVFETYLDDARLLVWFGVNPSITRHPKFKPIPIGLANRCWNHGNIATFDAVIEHISHYSKEYLLGLNFNPSTNIDARKFVYDYFISQPFCSNISHSKHKIYLENMAKTKFILSPTGNGLDCHRTWEALLMGAIPIVFTSFLDELFVDLPVVIVRDWYSITPDFLEKMYQYIQENKEMYNREKMYFEYWANLIKSYK